METNNIDYKPEIKEVEVESAYSEDILDLAADTAKKMIMSGDAKREILFGRESGSVIISRDPDAVVWTKEIIVDGEKFYIGLSQK